MECRLGLIQLHVGEDKAANLAHARQAIAEAVRQGAELVVLPEMFCVPYETARFADYAESAGGPAQAMLAAAARENGCWLIGGSICEEAEGRYYNTSYVYDPAGTLVAKHRKMHLFDIDIKGGQYFKESDVLSPGGGLTLFETPWGKVGLAICFDIRFADMAMAMVDGGARMLIYPASFNMSTGPRHWELLFRARAMDGQCYAIGVAPARDEGASYVSWAHSIVVDPWAQVVRDLGTEEKIEIVTLDLDEIDAVRQQIPLGRA